MRDAGLNLSRVSAREATELDTSCQYRSIYSQILVLVCVGLTQYFESGWVLCVLLFCQCLDIWPSREFTVSARSCAHPQSAQGEHMQIMLC